MSWFLIHLLGLKFALSQDGLQILKENNMVFIVKKVPHSININQDAIEVVCLSGDDDVIDLCHTYDNGYTHVEV
jgi:hypothetical protein